MGNMSMKHVHPMFWTAGNSPRQVTMATVQAVMISGRYRCGALTRHWSSSDNGYCSLSTLCHGILDDIYHILVECVALRSVRKKLFEFVSDYSSKLPTYLQDLIMIKCSYSNPDLCQFLLDCSLDHDVIFLAQNYGDDIYRHIFLVTRTWIYC